MAIPLERQLLTKMLSDGALEDSDLRRLIRLPEETSYLEFKDGAELLDKKAAATVRQNVTALANADGGLLIIGVSDGQGGAADREFTSTHAPGGQPLAAWVSNVLGPIAGGFSPPPRIQVLPVDGCDVLLIAVARAPMLISCDGEYWLRLGNSTRIAPPWLISDLLLGRRSRPSFEIRPWVGSNGSKISFVFAVENVGIVPAERLSVGLVAWALTPEGRGDYHRLTPTFRSFVDAPQEVRLPSGEQLALVHSRSKSTDKVEVDALETVKLRVEPLLENRQPSQTPMRSALYLSASGHPPVWYQYDWVLPEATHQGTIEGRAILCHEERPVVEWNSEWRPEYATAR